MTMDTNNPGFTLKERVVGWSKDLLTVMAALTLIGSMSAVVLRPWVQPFLNLPEAILTLSDNFALLQSRMDGYGQPELISFQGIGQVVGRTNFEVGEGGTLTVGYFLRRNASCDTDILVRLVDVDRNQTINVTQIPAVRSAVSSSFSFFKVDVALPTNLRESTYTYHPEIIPLECGVYGTFNAPPSDYFTVGPQPDNG